MRNSRKEEKNQIPLLCVTEGLTAESREAFPGGGGSLGLTPNTAPGEEAVSGHPSSLGGLRSGVVKNSACELLIVLKSERF